MSWDPDQYLKFRRQRERPFHDLLAQVPALEPRAVADLGCGPGHLSADLERRYPGATIWGVDTSAEMIERARADHGGSRLRFVEADLRTWRAPAPIDLIVSNATLHWVPDHASVLAELVDRTAPGGVLAFQVPNNFGEPSHLAVEHLLKRDPWRQRCATMPRAGVERPAWYLEHLGTLGLDVDVWETTYLHLLPDPGAILEWMTGTTLRPVLARLDQEEQERFRGELLAMLGQAYPRRACGVVFPFRRIFVVGRRSR